MTSLRSSDVFCSVAEQHLIPNARDGHVFVDLGTTEVEKTRDLATVFAEKGSALIDAPVSGGPHGSETGTLRIFVGGAASVVEKISPDFRSSRGTEIRGILRSERFWADR